MKKIITVIAALTLLLVFLQCKQKEEVVFDTPTAFLDEVKGQVQEVSPEELTSIIDTAYSYLLIDVREKEEHDAGYIEESVHLSRGLLEFKFSDESFWYANDLEKPYEDDLIIVYSRKDGRAILASATIQKMGYTNVKYLEGGYKNWESKFPDAYVRNEED
jgi:rhodanese-related sulfurtransferase